MTHAAFAAAGAPGSSIAGTAYRPGVCNIGPAEIERRRRSGHVGVVATVALFAVLVAIDAPPPVRLIVGLPATVAGSGYLQARFRFCAGFGSRGIYNFDEVGQTMQVVDDDARRRDRTKARQIGLGGLAIGAAVGVVAALLPI